MSIVEQLRPMLASGQRRYYTWRLADMHRRAVASQPDRPGPALDPAVRQEALMFLGSLVKGYRDLRWHEAFARITGQPSAFYLPDDIFFALLMPRLNPRERSAILSDKNHFDRLVGLPPFPATVGRLMNGRLLDPQYRPATAGELVRQLPPDSPLVVKPSRVTGNGKGVTFVEAGKLASALDGLTDAIVQLPVAQHRDIAVLNTSSLNTVRTITYRRLDGEVVHLGSLLRIGRPGSRVDNTGSGGLFCGIDNERGVLKADGFGKEFRAVQAHPDNGLLFGGRKIPGFAAARDAIVAAHRQLPWVDLATWDLAIDSAGHPVTIEVNVGTTIFGFQVACGPAFQPVIADMRQRVGTRRYSRLLGFW